MCQAKFKKADEEQSPKKKPEPAKELEEKRTNNNRRKRGSAGRGKKADSSNLSEPLELDFLFD
jgi:hypothetical protein